MYRIFMTRGHRAYAVECDKEFDTQSEEGFDNLFDENIKDEFTITISPKERVEIRYDGTGVLEQGEELGLEVSYEGTKYSDNFTVNYTSSNPEVATVDAT